MHNFRDPETPLTPEQTDLRKRVFKEISNDLRGFHMGSWESSSSFYVDGSPCQTTRCIAGWTEFLAYGEVPNGPLSVDVPLSVDGLLFSDGLSFRNKEHERNGIELLGLTQEEYYERTALFYERTALFYDNEESALERMRKLADCD